MAQSTAVPKKARKNHGLRMTTLMDCMAAMPEAGAMRPSALMMATEKMK